MFKELFTEAKASLKPNHEYVRRSNMKDIATPYDFGGGIVYYKDHKGKEQNMPVARFKSNYIDIDDVERRK